MQRLRGRSKPVSPENFMGAEAGQVGRYEILRGLRSGVCRNLGLFPRAVECCLKNSVVGGSARMFRQARLSTRLGSGGTESNVRLCPCLQEAHGIDGQITWTVSSNSQAVRGACPWHTSAKTQMQSRNSHLLGAHYISGALGHLPLGISWSAQGTCYHLHSTNEKTKAQGVTSHRDR